MTEDIYIVSGNTCEVNVDVEGEYILTCVSVTGLLAMTTIDASKDYITYINSSGTTHTIQPSITTRSTVATQLISIITRGVCKLNSTDNLYYYNYSITDCSNNMRYLLGIKNLPTEANSQFQAQPSVNGPTFFQVVCDKLTGCGIVSPNVYLIGSMFQLQGPSYIGDMSKVSFSIRGVYDEDIEIDGDLLWHFQLTKLTKDKAQQKNQDMRMELQYGKSKTRT